MFLVLELNSLCKNIFNSRNMNIEPDLSDTHEQQYLESYCPHAAGKLSKGMFGQMKTRQTM